jgi:metal-responsive CopG/Arc/MetJ family transcriptional regulator
MIISIWIKKKSLNKIDFFARKNDMSRSAAITFVINQYIMDSIESP